MPPPVTAEEGLQPLVMGVFPRRDSAITVQLFRPMQHYLSQKLGREVVLETSSDFDTFQQHLLAHRYDLVHMNQYHYVEAHKQLAYEVVAQNEERGEATLRGAILVRNDSPYVDLQQLKGKKIIFGGGTRAMISYVVPTFMLRQAGLQQGDYEEVFAASPPDAVLATYLGQGDAGGAGELIVRMPVVTNKIDTSELRVLAVSKPLPHLVWAVKGEMAAAEKQILRQVLLEMKLEPEGQQVLKAARLTAFNPAVDADYDVHRNIIESVHKADGVDISE
ncbi:phosphate/phosphite/phosphonate ABC transporter substrate-binding protein [Pontibacter sp. JAM-7]|uniref:phosphate/phosphite/phosphonate ABC transporter substrate-binding protein n=1 Tax=Pontibacter sp. JAM-7 TaxID=3366581 RepID=UPI003AF60546